ncbi:hypothetical protein B0H14DRAFT_2338787, partial [Mycena olivaceomarginata]
ADIITLIYDHHKSRPKKSDNDQRSAAFSPSRPLREIRYTRPCLSAWATRLVGDHAYFRVGKMTRKTRAVGRSRRHLRARTDGRTENAHVVEWEDIDFTIDELGQQYKEEDAFLWYITECFTASRKKGKVVVMKARRHPVVRLPHFKSFSIISLFRSHSFTFLTSNL